MKRYEMHGVPVTELHARDGAVAVIADHGAHLLSWRPAGGSEALYLSERSAWGGNTAIRGGVPLIFPQFAERGDGKRHGFARSAGWHLAEAADEEGMAVARYVLGTGDVPGNAWPHRFALGFEVAIGGHALRMTLTVSNPSQEAWSFCAALHSYWRVGDVREAGIAGLQGAGYLDQVRQGREAVQAEEILRIDGEVDRIYGSVPGPLSIADGRRRIELRQEGFPDAVVWNPGPKAAALSDMAPGDEARFVCVEAGNILRPVILDPAQTFRASQFVRVFDEAS